MALSCGRLGKILVKLAIVRKRFASAGGAEQFIVDTTNALAELGVEVTLISEGSDGVGELGARLIKLPVSKGSRSHRYRTFQAAVDHALAQRSFTLVQSHERILNADIFRAGDGVHAAWVERLKRSRPWWRRLAMDYDPLHQLLMDTERRMARETDMVFVANSELVARELRDWLDVPQERLRVIENGVDLNRFRPATTEERSAARAQLGVDDGPVVAYVGSGFERKGAFQLVRALADRRLRDVKAVIAGRDKAQQSLMRLVNDLRLSKRVVVAGPVGDVRQILHAADLFVLPTLYDPMPNAALEALASGLPVVTTPDAGIAEAIVETGAGRVSAREPEALADAIHRALLDLATARKAALSLRPRFELSLATRKWLDLYRELS